MYKPCAMAEELVIITGDKETIYNGLLPQIKALTTGEKNFIANLANIAAALKQALNYFWVGFYLVDGDELVLGPFQGSVACTRISHGRGVCGTAWREKKMILVENVANFPGHIACSSLSKSELVIPIMKGNEVIGVLDVDSDKLSDFDQTDEKYLTELCAWISTIK